MATTAQERSTAWSGFQPGDWENGVNVRDFIQKNYTPYEGNGDFLAPATEATTTLWNNVMEGIKVENRTHAPYKIDSQIVSGINSHAAGYIDKDLETLSACKPMSRSNVRLCLTAA